MNVPSVSSLPYAYPLTAPELPTLGREAEINSLLDCLWRVRHRNLIVLGGAGVGKTHLVRAASALAPGHTFYGVSAAGLVAGAKYVGDFEKRVDELITTALLEQKRTGTRVVLFIDEIHTAVGAGSTRGERTELDLAQILKPVLSDGTLAVWGATTESEYLESIYPDRALRRRFQTVTIKPLSEADTLSVLRSFCKMYGDVDEGDLLRIVSEAERDRLPDSALERLDSLLAHRRRVENWGDWIGIQK